VTNATAVGVPGPGKRDEQHNKDEENFIEENTRRLRAISTDYEVK